MSAENSQNGVQIDGPSPMETHHFMYLSFFLLQYGCFHQLGISVCKRKCHYTHNCVELSWAPLSIPCDYCREFLACSVSQLLISQTIGLNINFHWDERQHKYFVGLPP